MSTFYRYNFRSFLSRFIEIDRVRLFDVLKELPALSPSGPWLAGGAIRRALIGDNLNSDLDFFFHDEEQLTSFRESLKDKGARRTADNDHVETYIVNLADKDWVIQLIKIRFYENVEELLDSFDFTITQFAFDGEDLIVGEFSLWDLGRKRLALHRLTYGVATMRRLIKYTSQGFTACAGTMQSILEAVVNDPSTIQAEVKYVD